MKDLYDDLTKFTLADAPGDEEYDEYESSEEEYDEEYDDGYDDGYDDEYDDEYAEEDYGENYPEGYDDRLNKVLDELAELKRGIAPAAMPPIYPQPYMMPQANGGNEVVMYNEISRLRDELSKTQSTQNLHLELSRLKNEMEKDARLNESQFLTEIKRLNEKIETLQKNEYGPQSIDDGYEPVSSGGGNNIDTAGFNRLIAINEAVVQNSKELDGKIFNEIAAIKKQLSSLPDFEEINRAISALRKNVKTPASDELYKLQDSVEKLSLVLSDKNIPAQASNVATVAPVIGAVDADNIDVLSQLYELKCVVGNPSPVAIKRNALMLELLGDLKKLKFDCSMDMMNYGAKLQSMYDFVKKVSDANESDIDDIVNAFNHVANEVLSSQVNDSTFEGLKNFALKTGAVSLSEVKQNTVSRFLKTAETINRESLSNASSLLTDLVADKNILQDNVFEKENDEALININSAISDAMYSDDSTKSQQEVKALIKELATIKVGELIEFPVIASSKIFRTSKASEETLLTKLNELYSLLVNRPTVSTDSTVPADNIVSTNSEVPVSVDNNSAEVLKAIEEINRAIGVDEDNSLSDKIAELKNQYVEIVDKLAKVGSYERKIQRTEDGAVTFDGAVTANDLSEQMLEMREDLMTSVNAANTLLNQTNELLVQTTELIAERETAEETAEELDRINAKHTELVDNFEFIKQKLSDFELFVTQIGDLRTDILSMPSPIDFTPQFDKLSEDILAQTDKLSEEILMQTDKLGGDILTQSDKLYDDITQFIREDSTNNLITVSDTVNNGLFDISNRINEVKLLVEESSSAEILANLTALKTEFDLFNDKVNVDFESAMSDRLRLMEDIAFVRAQIEAEGIDEEVTDELTEEKSSQDLFKDKITAGLDAVYDRLASLENTLVEDKDVSTETIKLLSEDVSAVKDILDIMATDPTKVSLSEDILSIKESNQLLSDTIAANNEESVSVRTVILEELNDIKTVLATRVETNPETVEWNEDIPTILEDLDSLLERMEDMEKASVGNKNDIVAHIEDLKEQIHLRELDESLTTIAASDDERQLMLKELQEIRERLVNVEEETQSQNDTTLSQLSLIMDQLTDMKNSLDATDEDSMALVATDIAEINDKIAEIADKQESYTAEALNTLTADIGEIKDKVLSDNFQTLFDKLQDDMSFVRSQIENTLSDDDNSINEKLSSEDINLILDDLTAIKEKLAAESEYDMLTEILSLREDIKASRIVDQNDVTSEIEAVRNEIAAINNTTVLEEIRSLRDDIILYKEESTVVGDDAKPTNDELNLVLSEIVSLRDEVQSYKDDMTTFLTREPQEVAAIAPSEDENITVILDELTAMRNQLTEMRDSEDEELSEDKQKEYSEQLDAINDRFKGVEDSFVSLKDDLTELKDIISRRTKLAEAPDTVIEPSSSELNVVLNEIINLKRDIEEVKSEINEENGASFGTVRAEVDSVSNSVKVLTAQINELLIEDDSDEYETDNELSLLKDDIAQLISQNSSQDISKVLAELEILKNQIAEIQLNQAMSGFDGETESHDEETLTNSAIIDELNAVKEDLRATIKDDIAALLEDLGNIKVGSLSEDNDVDTSIQDDLYAIKEQLATLAATSSDSVMAEIMALHESIANIKSQPNDVDSGLKEDILELKQLLSSNREESDLGVMNEILSLRDELSQLKDSLSAPADNTALIEELSALRAELSQLKSGADDTVLSEIMALREEIATLKSNEVESDNMGVMTEILALRDEFQSFRNTLSGESDNVVRVELESIKEDLRAIKEEPDLGVLNEILALRDEFQNLKEEVSGVSGGVKSRDIAKNEEVISEVKSLRDQLFAISMANVNDAKTGNEVYESYNNIILDELTALRDEVNNFKADNGAFLTSEIADIKETLASTAQSDESIGIQINRLKGDLEGMKADASNNAILDELTSLREELYNQREADMTTLNFMSEMAHLLERQNQYLSESSNNKITDEIESLKAEIATTLTSPTNNTGEIMNEISKLKAELTHNISEPVVIDNQKIIDELIKLKEEISKEKPTQENNLILTEIARLKDEISAFADREQQSDKDERIGDENLSKTINDLKDELTQIAGFVTEPPKRKNTKSGTKSTTSKTGAKTGAKSGAKSTTPKTGAKSGTKKPTTTTKNTSVSTATVVDDDMSVDEIISRIENTTITLPDNEDELRLDLAYTPNENQDDMDLASKLAKQVANKLIMEQLVQQLGDGGVPRSKVEEIVKDILPQEFNTVQMDESSDQVKRLANQMVLDKLRSRLKK